MSGVKPIGATPDACKSSNISCVKRNERWCDENVLEESTIFARMESDAMRSEVVAGGA